MKRSHRFLAGAALAAVTLPSTLRAQASGAQGELLARSVLPAQSFYAGRSSGLLIGDGPINGIQVPFVDRQPIQGTSAVLELFDGIYVAMSDNGYGGIQNSADYDLALYILRPNFRLPFGGQGTTDVLGVVNLRDPNDLIPFPIVNEFTGRRLTGADFDIESIQLAPDFTIWIGDEFGPWLLHFNLLGELIDPPIALPDGSGGEIRAPQNGLNEEGNTLRVMNAMQRHATRNGSPHRLVCSPWDVMLADGDANTAVASRVSPPAGLSPASSEVHDVSLLQSAGYDVVCYTVNDGARMTQLIDLGVDGIISDNPALLYERVAAYDFENNGTPGDLLDQYGLIDIEKFDAQGHRGARDLRPENTLPAIEAALDYLMTTLEFDTGITSDGVAVLGHDPYLSASKVRRRNGQPYTANDEVLIRTLTRAQLQQQFVADKLLAGRPLQSNDRALSPVTQLFALLHGMPDAYTIPTLSQVFEFVTFYRAFYASPFGGSHPDAARRARNAGRVRFNVETKINPRTDRDDKGNVFAHRTVGVGVFATTVADTIRNHGMTARADIQSFDFRTLLAVHLVAPEIRTVCLFGDFPKVGAAGDGTNLQPDQSGNTPWLAGMEWPYRVTTQSHPFTARGSGGFEGMALSTDGQRLLPLLERPLVGGTPGELLIREFDLASKSYTNVVHRYQLHPSGSAIGDFVMFSPSNGLVIERDGTQGNLNGFKKVYEVRLSPNGGAIVKREAVDLLRIRDPHGVAVGQPGDVGIGAVFAMPFVTIEGILYYSPNHIGVLNDNNFPFSVGRHVGSGAPDDNEFVIVTLDVPLGNL